MLGYTNNARVSPFFKNLIYRWMYLYTLMCIYLCNIFHCSIFHFGAVTGRPRYALYSEKKKRL